MPTNSDNWFITGGCGFIGSSLISHLRERSLAGAIRVYDNLSNGTLDDLQAVAPDGRIVKGTSPMASRGQDVELVQGDILDRDLLAQASKGARIMVHLAANTGVQPSIADPMADMQANVMGTVNALEACRANGIKHFVFASSGAPIGLAEPPLNEQAVCRPISPYGASKLAGEAYCHAYFASFGINTVALRFSNVYGPLSGKKGSVVAKFLTRAFGGQPLVINGDGGQTRDFIYSEDLVRAVTAAAGLDKGGELFQIATARETSIKELADLLLPILKEEAGIIPSLEHGPELTGDVRRNYAEIDKARTVLGWSPEMGLKQGLRHTVRWFVQKQSVSS